MIQSRELFWLGALTALITSSPSGWLYWETNLWMPAPWVPLEVISSLNGTSPFTDFFVANYEWYPTYTDIFANGGILPLLSSGIPSEIFLSFSGDGMYVYPGADGPVGSIRLEAIRDGLEDWELFLKAGRSAIPLLELLVRGPTDWTEDPLLLESTRRAIAQYVTSE